jgi:hypothetical protein
MPVTAVGPQKTGFAISHRPGNSSSRPTLDYLRGELRLHAIAFCKFPTSDSTVGKDLWRCRGQLQRRGQYGPFLG